MFKDYLTIKGHLTLDEYDVNDNLIYHWEENNLIVDSGRRNVAETMAGFADTSSPINKIVFGSLGTTNNDTLSPKTTMDGFNPSITQLFSEQATSVTDKGYGSWYAISFTPPVTNGALATIINQTFKRYTDTVSGLTDPITIAVNQSDKNITYTITCPPGYMYDAGTTYQLFPISEAALYCGTDLFAMKCFPVRLKTNDSKLIVNWTIYF